MNTSTTSSSVAPVIASVTAKPTLSQDDADTVLSSLRKIHEVVRNMGDSLPSWEKCSQKDIETVGVRALNLLAAKAKAEREAAERGIRMAIKKVIETHMVKARAEKAEFDAISPTLRARLGLAEFPDTVKVSVSDFVPCFAEGLTLEQIVHNLSNMSYKLGKTSLKGNHLHYVIVPFSAE